MQELNIKSVSPKYDRSTNKIIWYGLTFVNDAWTYTKTEFYSVEDMKNLYWCVSEKDCLALKWEIVYEKKDYILKKLYNK